MFKIVSKRALNEAKTVVEFVIEAPLVARKALPGQFIIFRLDEYGERVPVTIAGYDREKGTVTIMVQPVGQTTQMLNLLEAGDEIADFVGPLGRPTNMEGLKRVCVVGGGVGNAIAYPVAKGMHDRGIEVDMVAGFRSKDIVILEDEMRAGVTNLYITTDDGSYGEAGFNVTKMKALLDAGEKYDEIMCVGPTRMMQRVCDATKEYGIKTIVSMNPIMVDGTGMCGACRLVVGDEVKFACVDGPEFDGHLVDFDQAMKRQLQYKTEEGRAMLKLQEGDTHHGGCGQCH